MTPVLPCSGCSACERCEALRSIKPGEQREAALRAVEEAG